MKLLRCYIGRYGVLRQLKVEFSTSITDDSLALDFLVGPNGCGKSTLLQALAEIFHGLEVSIESVGFPFMVEYELENSEGKQHIYVANCNPGDKPDEDRGQQIVRVNQTVEVWDAQKLLPKTIAILTTGHETRWQQILASPIKAPEIQDTLAELSDEEALTRRALHELPGPPPPADEEQEEESEAIAGRVTLIPTELLSLVTLCGALVEISRDGGKLGTLQDVFDDAQVKRICGFSLRFRLNEGIAKKATRDKVMELAEQATRAVHLGSDRLLYFDLLAQPKQSAEGIIKAFATGFDMYTWLLQHSIAESPAERVLQEVNVFIERGTSKAKEQHDEEELSELAPLHLLSWLSDGERSFLGRMSLFSMLRNRESLVLLDEPEVHFNDYWKRQIVYRLEAALKDQYSHALITTHSSITLTDVPNDDIIVLHRGDVHTQDSGKPRIPTLAADPSDIIVHVFQAPYAAGERAVRTVRRQLDELGERTDATARAELEKLQDQVGPGYWRYRVRRALQRFPRDAA